MSEESSKKGSGGAIAAIIAALPAEIKGILSVMLLFFAFFAMMFALTSMPSYFKNLISSSSSKDYCWDLKEVQGVAFKFNKCTGEALQLEFKQQVIPPSNAPKKP